MATERVLHREQPSPVDRGNDSLAHVFCHECHGYQPGSQVWTPVTSLCRVIRRVPRPVMGTGVPLCVVCADIVATNACPAGHPLRPLAEFIRELEQ